MSYRNRTGIYIDYNFDWKGKSEYFSYEIPDSRVVADGIRAMFEWLDMPVDARDTDLINGCYTLGIEFEDNEQFQEYCKKQCEEDARFEFEEEQRELEEIDD